jgi:iron-sulfur cluster assembly protein
MIERKASMSVTLTELAAKEIKRVITEQKLPEDVALRIGVAGGGCSGFEYRLGFDEGGNVDEVQDSVSQQHGVRIAVDKKSALYLDGTTIDFHDGIDRRGFVFDNPNAVKSCGCGSSFQA